MVYYMSTRQGLLKLGGAINLAFKGGPDVVQVISSVDDEFGHVK